MSTISLCMIVKNEEEVLARCLDCVKDIVDEIIIVDTGSKDRTKEIAAQYTDKIYDFEWIDDFAAARNFAFSKGTSEWLMWLDADDILEKDSQKAFLSLKKNLLNISEPCIALRYDVSFDKNGILELSSIRERIARKNANPTWTGRVHETFYIKNKEDTKSILIPEIIIKHKKDHKNIYSERNLNIYKKMISDNIELDNRDLYHLAMEYFNINYYLEAIKYFEESIKKDLKGALFINAIITLSECYIQINQYKKSLNILFDYLKEHPPSKGVLLKIAKIYWEQKKPEHALKWTQMCIGMQEKNISFLINSKEEWFAHQYAADIYFAIKDFENALKEVEILIKKFPKEPGFLENKKQILEQIKKEKKE